MTAQGYGVRPEVFFARRDAVEECGRVRIFCTRNGFWTKIWREIDPRRLYMRLRTIYVYARTVDETPLQWKFFRLSRIEKVQQTGMSVTGKAGEDGFLERLNNAFAVFLGEEARRITIKFTGQVRHYVEEALWYPSQKLKRRGADELLFAVEVAYVHEVIRCAKQFGAEAQVLAVQEESSVRLQEE